MAAAVTVPLLMMLYFLKLRRRYVRMASTLLWRTAVEDLEVNTPFQRLRFSALLLLQMLVLASLLVAMARPVTEGEHGGAERIVLLIDRSASMNAVDADGRSRLDAAKEEAIDTVDRLRRSGGISQIMVIAFARTAHVVTSFDYDRSVLIRAIESIEPTDEVANLDAALQLASGFAGDSEEAGAQAGEVVLFSDGAVAPPRDRSGYRLRAGSFRFVQVGPAEDQPVNNLGIVSFSARRDYEDPARVLVFSRLINTSASDVSTVLTLSVDGTPEELKRLDVPAATADSPGEATATFTLELHTQAVLQLQHNHQDDLANDDVASLVMPSPEQPRVLLVHAGSRPDTFLSELISDMDPQQVQTMTHDAFAELDPREIDTGEVFDMVVFDRVSPQRLPGVPSLTFGGIPRGVGVTEPRSDGGRRVLSWDRQHPIMRHVSLDTILYAGFGGFELPSSATPLAFGAEGPIIALMRTRGARHVVVGFDLNRSNWPLHVSIVVFMQNVLDYITLAGTGQTGLVHAPGEAITVRATSTADALVIDGPIRASLNAEPGAVRSLPALRQSGVYRVGGAAPPMHDIAVSMLSDSESNIRTRGELVVNSEATMADRSSRVVPRELWPWLVAFAALLLMVEWLVYVRKVSV